MDEVKKSKYLKRNTIILFILLCVVSAIIVVFFHKSDEDNRLEELNNIARENSTERLHRLLNGEILFEIENNSDLNISKDFNIKIYDKENVLSGEIGANISHIFPHRKTYGKTVSFGNDYLKYDYDVTTKVITDKIKYCTDKISIVDSKVLDDKIMVKISNNTNNNLSEMKLGVLYYNNKNEIIGYNENIQYNISGNMVLEDYFDNYVLDDMQNKINYDHYEPVINYAFYYEESSM